MPIVSKGGTGVVDIEFNGAGANVLYDDGLFRPAGGGGVSGVVHLGMTGIAVNHLKVISISELIALAAGHTDIYTVPVGKKAMCVEVYFINPAGSPGAEVCFAEYKISGVYQIFDFITNGSVAGTSATALLAPMILNAGETFAVNATNGGRLNIYPFIVEFDDPGNLFVTRTTAFIAGDNTILTVPAGGGISLLGNPASVAAGAQLKGCIWYFNNSGINRTIGFNLVPSGGSPGAGNNLSSGISVSAPAITRKEFFGGANVGDFFSINSDANSAGQIGWINYQLYP